MSQSTPALLPALFIGHGSPMNAVEDNPSTQGWRAITAAFAKPRAIICFSAHWLSEGVQVCALPQPRTIHDFGGFPPELFEIQYRAPGAPGLAGDVVRRLCAFGAELDHDWGLDHGAWSVLVHMYPGADVPVLQVSLDARRAPEQHYAIARALAPLRQEGVLLLGSGNLVHNLGAFFHHHGAPRPGDTEFDDFIIDRIAAGDHGAILNYRAHPAAAQAAPDWDHFFPLFYALGAQGDGEAVHVFNRHYFPGISMSSVAFGLDAASGRHNV